MKPRTLILRAAGTNCDGETAHAFELAGADVEYVHVNRLLENPELLDTFQLLAVPGGFSYGDDIAAGRILANQLMHHLREPLRQFVDHGKPVIGVCNGFQVLIKTDLLAGSLSGQPTAFGPQAQSCTLTHNDSHRFIDRWIHLSPRTSKCIWTTGLPAVLELPVAHGEGKFVPASRTVRDAIWDRDQVALVYSKSDGAPAGGAFPDNPNGSVDDIAGICDETGLVFGLMPHPERYVDPTQHPSWTRQQPLPQRGQGLLIFSNAVRHARDAVGAGI